MLEKSKALADELVRIRRQIHESSELSFQEHETAALVSDTLSESGIDHKTGVGITVVVGQIGTGNGPTIANRADMDALPIHENTGLDYSSKNAGAMHACGHDAHTAILLAAAQSQHRHLPMPYQ